MLLLFLVFSSIDIGTVTDCKSAPSGFEEIHLKNIMNQLGAKSANDLKIGVELQTILDPCNVRQKQI